MTIKENYPTKLFLTTVINHKAAIYGLIINYRIEKIRSFFESLACSGYNDTLILLYGKIDENTLKYIITFSEFFKIVMIPLQKSDGIIKYFNYINSTALINAYRNNQIIQTISISNFQTVDFLQLQFASGDFRFEIAYYLYKNHFFDEYDLLFLTDIGDVIFQLDIRLFNYTDGVYVTEEADISVRQTHFWLEMFNASFKPFENKVELCVGTLILVGKNSFSFLNDLHNEIKDHLDIVIRRPNFQGPLNFLIYNNTYNFPFGFIHFLTTSHGIINSIGKLNYHMMHFNKNNPFLKIRNIYDIYYHDRYFLLYNLDFQKLAVIHHTKYIPITMKLTFKGIMAFCYHMSPKIYMKINEISSQNAT